MKRAQEPRVDKFSVQKRDKTKAHIARGISRSGIESVGDCFTFLVRFQVYDYTCFVRAHLTQGLSLSCCGLSSRGGTSGHPRPPSVEALVYRGCPCPDPPVCHRVQDDSAAKRQPFFVLVGVVTPCVLCARVRGRVSRSCAT